MRILAINPGSTSTKIGIYDDTSNEYPDFINRITVRHTGGELAVFPEIQDQLDFRLQAVLRAISEAGLTTADFDAFAGRGGGIEAVRSGVYSISEKLLRDARMGLYGQHPAQLAAQICAQLAFPQNKPAYIADPPSTDELSEIARLTGLSGIYRKSSVHALNQKEAARRYCAAHLLRYEEENFIIAHLGGGISVAAHERGRIVDTTNNLRGSGAYSPTRAGSIPALDILDLSFSGEFTKKQLESRLTGQSGMSELIGTADMEEAEKMIERGDARAKLYYEGMIYNIAKDIGSMAAVLRGDIKAIIITGGLASNSMLTDNLKETVRFIADVEIMPGEFEIEALINAALRCLRGEETALEY